MPSPMRRRAERLERHKAGGWSHDLCGFWLTMRLAHGVLAQIDTTGRPQPGSMTTCFPLPTMEANHGA